MEIGTVVIIQMNSVHPRLAGQIGTVVQVTPVSKSCGIGHVTNRKRDRKAPSRCGGNPILEVEGVGRVLVPAACVAVVEAAGAAA